MEYMLGIADLTGELMRLAINSVGSGHIEAAKQSCQFLQTIYNEFMPFTHTHKELGRKISTVKQSLNKVEMACYTVHIRGEEIPKHMLADVIRDSQNVDRKAT